MQRWKWLGVWAALLMAQPAGAQPTAVFPPEAAVASADQAAHTEPAAPEPVVHDVAPQRQAEQLTSPVAEPAALPKAVSPPAEVARWYGGDTLTTDGISLALALAGGIAEPNGEALFWMAGGGYVLGAPIVHLVHGNPGRAAASLGLRVALPMAFFGVGTTIEDCRGQDFCGVRSFVIGVPLGMVAAMALDAAVLARDTVHRPVALAPTASFGPNGTTVGLAGSF
jgi:hypothetical protein